MKQILYKTIAIAAMFAVVVNMSAKSWRVNSNTTRGANFADINAAMSSEEVQDGDTLYLDPGCNLTSTQNVTKRVTIIGNGFFHDKQQPYGFATISGNTYLRAAGCKIEGVIMTNVCHVSADYVTIERCKISCENYIIYPEGTCKYATIRDCYLYSRYYHVIRGHGSTNEYSAYWTIENNIIIADGTYSPGITDLNSATIMNNYIIRINHGGSYINWCLRSLKNCTITNNIIINQAGVNYVMSDCTDCVINNNIFSSSTDAYPNYPSNKYLNSNDQAAIFVMTGANDLQYQLCEGSPAKGYATDGGDCGPYGSGYTYVPGGLPLGKPYYTEATIGSVAHDGKVNVTLKISVQDE